MERRGILICAGYFYGIPFSLKKEDLIIAVDGGFRYCQEEGITPSLILGDLDSLTASFPENSAPASYNIFSENPKERAEFLSESSFQGIPLKQLPVVKNDTDLLAAIKLCLEEGIREIHIFGALEGRRFDHSLAALQSLAYLTEQKAKGYLYGKEELITALQDGSLHFPKGMQGTCSVFSYSEEARGVEEKGLLYQIDKGCLKNSFPIGVSNAFTGDEAEISVEKGMLFISYGIENLTCKPKSPLL